MDLVYLCNFLPLVAALFSLPWVIGYLLANYVVKKTTTLSVVIPVLLALTALFLMGKSMLHPDRITSISQGIANLLIDMALISQYRLIKLIVTKRFMFLLLFGTIAAAIGLSQSILQG